MVFINSLGTDFRIWDEVRTRLHNDTSTLVYDKRGHGLSDIGNTPYTIKLLAADLIGLFERLSIKRAIICGLSVGGLIAQSIYAARPDLVTGLILSNTAHKIGTAEMWDARIAAIQQDGLASILDTTMPRWFTPAYRRPDNPAYRAYCNMFVRQPLSGYMATCAALREADLTEVAKHISVPTLCLVGDQDGSTPPTLVRELASLIPGADFSEIAASGHIPCVEQPDAYVTLLRNFLSNRFEHGE
ncbi:3-oxoadipate enol-lactonase [Ochrobactrum oryzae]|nr:3-oxoadipate enol-lactonase [Brucella oryzae]NKC22960.1 3-oxoadipate enol-lactonase [Brucella oryzae]